jgi:protein-tyrosine phosphatase
VGVQRDAVVADYVATGSRIEAILARLRASPTYAEGVDQISTEQHTPRASGMERFLDLIDTQHGGVTRWLVGQGFGPGDLDRLRHKLVEA